MTKCDRLVDEAIERLDCYTVGRLVCEEDANISLRGCAQLVCNASKSKTGAF